MEKDYRASLIAMRVAIVIPEIVILYWRVQSARLARSLLRLPSVAFLQEERLSIRAIWRVSRRYHKGMKHVTPEYRAGINRKLRRPLTPRARESGGCSGSVGNWLKISAWPSHRQ